MKHYTTIQDQDRKLDIMDHVNQDHSKELLIIAQTYGKNDQISNATIADIYEEGILLHIQDLTGEQPLFVEFELKGDLEEQILYLAYNSFAKQKIEFSHNARQFFEVIQKEQVSKNMTRLTIKSQRALPRYYAGYAYGFILKALEKVPVLSQKTSNKSGRLKNAFDHGFLWLLKHLSSPKRQKLLESMNKDIRLYTLRQAFSLNQQTADLHYGYVDIFTHGRSPGSLWVEQLQAGSLISSRTETDDKHEHLLEGQTVLIADETAYPALAGILDFWLNPIHPIIILLCADEKDLEYFQTFTFPEHCMLRTVVGTLEQQVDETILILQACPQIDAVWGAMENKVAKTIRHYVRNDLNLQGKNNHIKGYWRFQTNARIQ